MADWFGSTFIFTLLYNTERQVIILKETKQEVHRMVSLPDRDEQHKYLLFQAERRIGQGESASSPMWITLYNIILEWINPAN
jgi:hypothetical protein